MDVQILFQNVISENKVLLLLPPSMNSLMFIGSIAGKISSKHVL